MHVKFEALMQLAEKMQGTAEGVSLMEIQDQFDVSRRTAERMRDSIGFMFPQMVEVPTGERMKRWALPAGTLNRLISFSFEELMALQNAINSAKSGKDDVQLKYLQSLETKILALQPTRQKNRVETDLEALMQAEGIAYRPGPKLKARTEFVGQIREAIITKSKIRIKYYSRNSEKTSRFKLCPYGIIYGQRHYLVAFNLNPNIFDYHLFDMATIQEMEVLPESFNPDMSFSLQSYMENSFGIYQGDPIDVVWKFSPDASKDAKNWLFHPKQKTEELADGSLIVRFTAGGQLEMDWHLYTWGDEVEDLTDYSIDRD